MAKRLISGLISVCMSVSLLAGMPVQPAHAEELSGQCGENVYWRYEDGCLTVSGEGMTWDFKIFARIQDGTIIRYSDIPWYDFRNEIQTADIADGVTAIGSYAFIECENLTSVTLPDTVHEIGAYAFFGCAGLTSMHLPNSIQIIGACAFERCVNLKDLTFPDSVREIGEYAFYECESLTELSLPNTVQEIGQYAFFGCQNLTSVSAPDSGILVGSNAFTDCETLLGHSRRNDGSTLIDGKLLIEYTDVPPILYLPDGTTSIANALWKSESAYGNTDLFEVNCPESLRTIGAETFYNCKNLMCLNLNDGLEHIGVNALSQCSALHSLTIPASVTEIGEQTECALTDIYGTPGTAAEQFAIENGITFHDVAELDDQPDQGRDMTLDYAKDGWYFGNSYEIFGSEYYLTDADRQRLIDHGFNPQNVDTAWNGSCVGLAVTVILAKNGVFSPSQLQNGAQSLSEVQASEAVQSFINYFQCMQGSDGKAPNYEPRDQQFYRMLQIAKNIRNGASPFLLTFATQTGSHGVVGYGQESGAWEFGGRTYDGRILVWDSNFPGALNEQACLYYDSETYAYCIPSYGVYMAEGDTRGGIIMVCNDLDVLNAYPYLFADGALAGDLNGDGTVSAADAVLLQRWLLGVPDTKLTDRNAADLNADGILNAADLTRMKQMLLRAA